jgi:hypothetical protein
MNNLPHVLKKVLNFELQKGNLVQSASRGGGIYIALIFADRNPHP